MSRLRAMGDMMYWSGGGDNGIYDFPLDLDQVERIDITNGRSEWT